MKESSAQGGSPSYEELLQICEQLQQQVERGVIRHQQLIRAKNELDDELERYVKLQQYSPRALQAESIEALTNLTLEVVADVFQQPKVAVYEYRGSAHEIRLLGQLGFPAGELAAHYPLRWEEVVLNVLVKDGTDPAQHPLPALPLREALIGGFVPRQQGTAPSIVLVAGFSAADQHFMPPINERLLPVFNTLVQKIGLHFEQQGTVERLKEEVSERISYQHQLERIRTDLEHRVAKRTEDLARNNARLQHEIEERREVELELRRSNTELEQFAYVASHDLKTPLRSIGSFAQLLSRRHRKTLAPEAREYLDFILASARQLDRVINDLLNYSQISTIKQVKEELDLNELVANTLEQIKGILDETGAVVEYNDLPCLFCERVQMEHLFHNLITNAIKFSKPGEVPRVQISVEHQSRFLQFRIRDNGIGISPKFKDKVFELFQRLHTDKEYVGTGLGLSICRKIVHTVGGEIWFEPNASGTDFYFTIPFSCAAQRQSNFNA
jgi:signal transduction histidine kinase